MAGHAGRDLDQGADERLLAVELARVAQGGRSSRRAAGNSRDRILIVRSLVAWTPRIQSTV